MNKRPDFNLIEIDKMRKRKRRELSDLENQEIHEAFKLFDTDNDDKIDYHELKVALRALGFDLKKNDVQKLMTDYDMENIGKISLADFIEICKFLFLNIL
jgi:centrin-3